MGKIIIVVVVTLVIVVIGIWLIRSKTKKIETPPKEENKEQKP